MNEEDSGRPDRREEGTESPGDDGREGTSWPRRVLLVLAWILAGVVLLVGAVLVAVQFDGVSTRLGRWIAGTVSSDQLQVRLEGLTGSWIGGLTVTGLEITGGGAASPAGARSTPSDTLSGEGSAATSRLSPGAWALSADTLSLDYDLLPLLRRIVDLEALGGRGIAFRMRMAAADSAPSPDTEQSQSSWDVRIGRAELRGTQVALAQAPDTTAEVGEGGEDDFWVFSEGVVLARDIRVVPTLSAVVDTVEGSFRPPGEPAGWGEIRGSLRLEPERAQIDTFLLRSPESDLALRGTVPLSAETLAPPEMDVTFAARPLSMRDIGPFLPQAMSDSLRLQAEGSARTTGDTLRVLLNARSGDAGRVDVDGKLAGTPRAPTVVGEAVLDAIDLQAWGLTSSPLTLDGTLAADVTGGGGGTRGSANLEAEVRDRRGTRTVHATLQARSDSAGKLWRGEWVGETEGITSEGEVELTPGDVPSWALSGRVAYDRSAGAPRLPGIDLHRLQGSFRGEGEGTAPDSMDARVGLKIASARVGRASVDSLVLSAEVEAGAATFALGGALAGGTLQARGDVDPTRRTARLSQLRLTELNVMALLGDSTASSLNATVSGSVTSTDPLRAVARLELGSSHYGGIRLGSGSASADVEGEVTTFEARMALEDSAGVRAEGRVAMLGDSLRLTLDTLAYAHLDLRTLAPAAPRPDSAAADPLAAAGTAGGLPTSDLSGGASGAVLSTPAGLSGRIVLDVDSSRIGTQTLRDLRATAILEPGEATVELDLTTPAGGASGEIRVAGLAEGGALAVEVPALRFSSVDVGSLMGSPDLDVVLSGVLEGEVQGATLEEMTGNARLRLESSTVAVTTLEAGALDVTLDRGLMEATLKASTRDGGDVDLQASADLDADVPTFSSRGAIDLPSLVLPGAEEDTASLGYLSARYELEGRGTTPDSARGRARLLVDSARWSGLPVDSARVQVALTDAGLQLDTLLVRSPAGTVSGGGRLPRTPSATAPGTLRVHAEVDEAAFLEELVGAEILAIGTGETEATARGSLERLELEVEGRVNALLWNDLRVQGLQLRAQAHRTADGGFREAFGELGMDRFYVSGTPVRRLEVSAGLEENDELRVTASADIDDLRDARLTAHLEGMPGPAAVRVDSFTFRAEDDTWTLSRPARIQVLDGVEIDSLLIEAEGQTLEARGRVASAGPLSLQVGINRFDVETIGDLLGYPDLRGSLTGYLELLGTAEAPRLNAEMDAVLDPGSESPVDVRFTADYADQRMRLDSEIATDHAAGARVSAVLPLGLSLAGPSEGLLGDQSVQVTLTADSLDLGWASPLLPSSLLENLEGVLDGSVEIGGTGSSPRFEGALVLSRFSVGVPPLGVRYDGGHARLAFRGDGIQVDSLRVRAGDGSLGGSGSVRLLPLDQPAFDITLRPDAFLAVNNATARSVISGEVELTGNPQNPSVAGRLVVDQADLHLEELIAAPSVESVTLSEEAYREMARVFGYRPPEAPETSPDVWEQASIDLSVELRRNSWIRMKSNPELALQFTGGLTVEKPAGEDLRLVGTIEGLPQRSYVEQFGRRFSLARGTVTFQGVPTATEVDIRAEYDVPSRDNPGDPAVVIALEITGTVEDLNLQLASTPELEPSDMVSYLVTGAPAGRTLGGNRQVATEEEETSLTETGQALALNQLSRAVEAYAREQVGLDVVEITTDGLDGVTLLAGRYVSPELYLGIRQPLNLESSSSRGRQSQRPEIEVELEALRWLLLNLQAGGQSGAEFYVRTRIAYD